MTAGWSVDGRREPGREGGSSVIRPSSSSPSSLDPAESSLSSSELAGDSMISLMRGVGCSGVPASSYSALARRPSFPWTHLPCLEPGTGDEPFPFCAAVRWTLPAAFWVASQPSPCLSLHAWPPQSCRSSSASVSRASSAPVALPCLLPAEEGRPGAL